MKRSKIERDNDDQKQLDSLTMANYLMYISRGAGDHNNQEYDDDHHHHQIEDSNIISSNSNSSSSSQSRVFECKTCNRKFASFQALGGHRASHKKPRLMGLGTTTCDSQSKLNSDTIKLKTHECTICGLEFAIGQALGGHMRKHRACSSMNDQKYRSTQFHRLNLINGSNSQVMPVVKKSDNTSRRVLFLDLNLTPLENDMNILQLEKGFSYG